MLWLRGSCIALLALAFVSCGGGGSGLAPASPAPVTNSSYLYITTSTSTISAYSLNAAGDMHSASGSPFNISGSGAAATVVNGYLYVSRPAIEDVVSYLVDNSNGYLTQVYRATNAPPPASQFPLFPTMMQACGGNVYGFNDGGWITQFRPDSGGRIQNWGGGASSLFNGSGASMVMDPTCQRFYFTFEGRTSVYGSSFAIAFIDLPNTPQLNPGTTPTALAISDDGKFLYVVNSGSSNITIYAVDPSVGGLTLSGSLVPAGPQPSAIVMAGGFVYVTNAGDGTISAYTRDAASGALSAVAGSPFAVGSNPIQVISAATNTSVSPTGLLLFVANQGSNNVSGFKINASGSLTALPGSPFNANGTPTSIAFAPAPKS